MAKDNARERTSSPGSDRYRIKDKTKKKSGKKSRASAAEVLREKRRNSLSAQIAPFILGVIALLFAVFIYIQPFAGSVGGAIGSFFKGIFAGGALAIPPVTALLAVRWRRDAEEGQNGSRTACAVGTVLLLSAILHICAKGTITMSPKILYSEGKSLKGGGFAGGIVGTFLWKCFRVAAPIMIVAGLIVLVPLLFGLTPRAVFVFVSDKIKAARERRAIERSEREILRDDRRRRLAESEEEQSGRHAGNRSYSSAGVPDADTAGRNHGRDDFEADVPMPDGDKYEDVAPEVDEGIFDAALRERIENQAVGTDGRITDKIDGYNPDEGDVEMEIPERLRKNDVFRKTDSENDGSNITPDGVGESARAVADSGVDDGEEENIDLRKIFANPEDAELFDKLCAAYMPEENAAEAELSFTREKVAHDGKSYSDTYGQNGEGEFDDTKSPEPPPYKFPPIELLSADKSKNNPGIRDELKENAVRLVEILRSFNVKTRIVDVSRGPTITRYELMPESGTKVRTISNLVDDIALNFATTGVRIEAPIPGKAAVGIEVPNKIRENVLLRSLIDDKKFTEAESKVTAALGKDVAGESVYLDVARMPHLLIAGTTGSGKSICINCILISLLYKASPDELKMILIDPKRVEFVPYDGLPHLLVPIVSDAKKAAGSLSWAVSEMERRYSLIEKMGVRDIKSYNAAASSIPGCEILPQIVIAIDELAELMMTAPDDVEASICRIAQKARAAGMYLIIGTQRPSVDVVTGLLKANIPSRIALTVASQVDSRTMIDCAGADRLIGKGDMLYKPLGAAKPIRVQGAYVSESEVKAVMDFIKEQNSGDEVLYSEEVIEQIEREAEKCGIPKKQRSAADSDEPGGTGDEDPMFRAALELAVESRKISTSLIQRRLSLGYGRAAKLIDRMEQLGYVSAPDGQKPRDVLISKQEFMEMVLKNDD